MGLGVRALTEVTHSFGPGALQWCSSLNDRSIRQIGGGEKRRQDVCTWWQKHKEAGAAVEGWRWSSGGGYVGRLVRWCLH